MTPEEIAEQLRQFERDPKQALNQRPIKEAVQGEGLPTLFGPESLQDGAYIEQRDRYRKRLNAEMDGQLIRLEQMLPGRAPFAQNDMAENLVDVPRKQILRSLEEMEEQGLRASKLDTSPWSDWYWPHYQGVAASRYADPAFPIDSEDWKQKRDYVLARPARAVFESGDEAAINLLSPAEKYDLLVGDDQFGLTAAMWAEGEGYYRASGKVERWMGMCMGWAPASYFLGRPRSTVQVLAADGRTKLRFYPSDLKALASRLWHIAPPNVRFLGGRCNDKVPAMDESGRVRSSACFDTNPGTWHLAVVNQIGVARRSLIIDATFDYEVWNQPVYSYSYSYFNPATRRPAASLKEARVEMAQMRDDRFRAYRGPKARSLVGIGMTMDYVTETMPTHKRTDGPGDDALKRVKYSYDLELDDDGRILGGEWYTNFHPDFLSTPPPGARAAATTDSSAKGEWNDDTIPESWRRAAVAGSRNGQPLEHIVAALFGWSQARGH